MALKRKFVEAKVSSDPSVQASDVHQKRARSEIEFLDGPAVSPIDTPSPATDTDEHRADAAAVENPTKSSSPPPSSPSMFSDSSSSADDSADDSQPRTYNHVVHINGGPGKPSMIWRPSASDLPNLGARLAGFLPQLREANRALEGQDAAALDLENLGDEAEGDGEGKQYIEMDLGLGVLEEKREGEDSDESSDEESDGEESGGDGDGDEDGGGEVKGKKGTAMEKDIMGKLMGVKGGRKSAGIQVVEDD